MFLRDAIKMNTLGTKMVLELTEGVKNLEVNNKIMLFWN